MLKAGIVGIKNSKAYIDVIQKLDSYSLVGLYDPSFQIDLKLFHAVEKGVLDFFELVNSCDLILFTADDKVFYPLIKEAISRSKAVFLDSFHKYSSEQLILLSKLSIEANSLVHISHPQLFHEASMAFQLTNPYPIVINTEFNIEKPDSLLKELRNEVANLFYLVNSNLRKVKVNIASTRGQIPDVYTLNFEFNNGCNCQLLGSALDMPIFSKKRIIGVNDHFEMDFTGNSYLFYLQGEEIVKKLDSDKNRHEDLVTRQLEKIYSDILNESLFRRSLDYEVETCRVLERVTDKLKLCMTIV